jgi:hypothetical protein
MVDVGGDEHLFAWLGPERPALHLQFQFSFHNHHEFIDGMDIILPYLPRRINPKVATEPA